jgi:chlorophyll(ide) b reductase
MELYGTHRNSISLEVSAVAMHGTPVCAGVVITGGAAGVGFAYADEFLARGHQAGPW